MPRYDVIDNDDYWEQSEYQPIIANRLPIFEWAPRSELKVFNKEETIADHKINPERKQSGIRVIDTTFITNDNVGDSNEKVKSEGVITDIDTNVNYHVEEEIKIIDGHV